MTLTYETAQAWVGDRFEIELSGEPIALKLETADRLGSHSPREGGAFSLVFEGPREPALEQATYPLSHSEEGRVDIFLVPIGQSDTAMSYEAVFN